MLTYTFFKLGCVRYWITGPVAQESLVANPEQVNEHLQFPDRRALGGSTTHERVGRDHIPPDGHVLPHSANGG